MTAPSAVTPRIAGHPRPPTAPGVRTAKPADAVIRAPEANHLPWHRPPAAPRRTPEAGRGRIVGRSHARFQCR